VLHSLLEARRLVFLSFSNTGRVHASVSILEEVGGFRLFGGMEVVHVGVACAAELPA